MVLGFCLLTVYISSSLRLGRSPGPLDLTTLNRSTAGLSYGLRLTRFAMFYIYIYISIYSCMTAGPTQKSGSCSQTFQEQGNKPDLDKAKTIATFLKDLVK